MKSWFRSLSLLIVIFFLLGGATVSSLSLRVARIADYGGEVTVQRGSDLRSIPVFHGMSLVAGDVIRTGKDAYALLRLEDGSSIRIYEASVFQVSELNQMQGQTRSVFHLWIGKIWVKVMKLVSSDSVFRVITPHAVIGVRGTEYFVSASVAEGTRVGVLEGKVAVGTVFWEPVKDGFPLGMFREYELLPAQEIQVPADGRPPRISHLKQEQLEPWMTGGINRLVPVPSLPEQDPAPGPALPELTPPTVEPIEPALSLPTPTAPMGEVTPDPVLPDVTSPSTEPVQPESIQPVLPLPAPTYESIKPVLPLPAPTVPTGEVTPPVLPDLTPSSTTVDSANALTSQIGPIGEEKLTEDVPTIPLPSLWTVSLPAP